MNEKRIFIGEQVTLTIDLDTSGTEADFPIAGELVARLALPGAATALLEVAPVAVDATAGTADITIDVPDDAAEGLYQLFVEATTGPTVYTDPPIAVLLSLRPSAVEDAPAEPTLAAMPYSRYLSLGGCIVAEAEWPRFRAEAVRTVRDITMLASLEGTDYDAELADAIARAADAHFEKRNAVASEKFGANYQVTYGSLAGYLSPSVAASAALFGTGLTYRGI